MLSKVPVTNDFWLVNELQCAREVSLPGRCLFDSFPRSGSILQSLFFFFFVALMAFRPMCSGFSCKSNQVLIVASSRTASQWFVNNRTGFLTSHIPVFLFLPSEVGGGGIPNPVSNYYLRATDRVLFTGGEALLLTDAVLQGY